jgi:hypothetical protein
MIRVGEVEFVAMLAVGLAGIVVVTVRCSIEHILGPSPISQVLEPVVGWVAIEVTYLHAIWAGANKTRRDELMHLARALRATNTEHRNQMAGWIDAGPYLLALEASILAAPCRDGSINGP